MTTKQLKKLIGSMLVMLFVMQVSVAQTYTLNNATSSLQVDGTSNLHDWDIKAENQKGKLTVTLDNGKVTEIKDLSFTVLTESLKSGKSGMDKNTYKALNAKKYKDITFKLTNVKSLDCGSSSNCKVTVTGNLTIAGTTKRMDISFDLRTSGNTITLTGNKKFNMTDFNVEPPTAMFGTVTTGDAVDVVFKSTFNK